MNKRLDYNFFKRDVLEIAPLLIGKLLVRKFSDGRIEKYRIIETEAYRGEEDTACHAKAGKTSRTAVMYKKGGFSYIYLCYGIHYLLNIVTGKENYPQAVLIRGIEGFNGPGKLTKRLEIDRKLNNINLCESDELWIETDNKHFEYIKTKRIGIDYASEFYRNIEWRFILK